MHEGHDRHGFGHGEGDDVDSRDLAGADDGEVEPNRRGIDTEPLDATCMCGAHSVRFDHSDDPFDQALAELDRLRRWLAGEEVPLSEVYVEGALGSLRHARESLIHSRGGHPGPIRLGFPNVAAPLRADGLLWCADLPHGWSDDMLPCRPDLGADLVASSGIREMSKGRYFGGMLVAALAYHAWLHLETGTVWSTDRGGALALVGALSGGRATILMDYRETRGALEERVVRAIATIGWRRCRSPSYEGAIN